MVQSLAGRGVSARTGIANAHAQPLYSPSPSLPRSESATGRGLMLPLYPGMTAADQDLVASEFAAQL
jgi:dTDP-4-amino-4,6-dideoxygalactose transaminase